MIDLYSRRLLGAATSLHPNAELARTAGVLASTRHARARWATLRTHLINVPGRVASSSRQLTLHLPLDWPWADAWQALPAAATGPPVTVTA